jgi:hypothetical protein
MFRNYRLAAAADAVPVADASRAAFAELARNIAGGT